MTSLLGLSSDDSKRTADNDEQLLLRRLRDFGCSLFQVISLGDPNMTRLMLNSGFVVDELDIEDSLHEAVRFGDYENVKLLLEFGTNVNALDDLPLTPIYRLFDEPHDSEEDYKKRMKILKLLIEHDALNFQPSDGMMTPLQYILTYAKLEVIELLTECGFKCTSIDALLCLAGNANDDVLEAIRDESFDVNTLQDGTESLLTEAILSGSLRKSQFFLERGANPNVVDRDGKTALIAAFTNYDFDLPNNPAENRLPIVRLLLQYGADAQYSYGPQQKTVFDEETNTGEVLESIIAHFALIESCGVTISNLILGKINSRNTRKEYFEDCKKQIAEMKETTINGSVTLYKLLTESHLKITRYARDPGFASKFEEIMKISQFLDPYYSISLHNRVKRAIREAQLKRDAIIVLQKIFLYSIENCTEFFDKILDYLNCDDLKNICEVYDF